jgi:hypothetical protein
VSWIEAPATADRLARLARAHATEDEQTDAGREQDVTDAGDLPMAGNRRRHDVRERRQPGLGVEPLVPRVVGDVQPLDRHPAAGGRFQRHRHRAVDEDDARVEQQTEAGEGNSRDGGVAHDELCQQGAGDGQSQRVGMRHGGGQQRLDGLYGEGSDQQVRRGDVPFGQAARPASAEPTDREGKKQGQQRESHPRSLATRPPRAAASPRSRAGARSVRPRPCRLRPYRPAPAP